MVKQTVRVNAVKASKVVKSSDKHMKISKKIENLTEVLVVDCETTIDFAQKLKIAGFSLYSLQKQKHLIKGIIIDYENTSEVEHDNIRKYTKENKLELIERYTFINEWLYPILDRGIPYVNHNIKFDIGAMATCWYFSDKSDITMLLCNCTKNKGYLVEPLNCVNHPAITVKHLPSGKYLFNVETEKEIGAIMDTMQLGKALLGANCPASLLEMGATFKCNIVKFISDEHGLTIDKTYLDYTMNDVLATTELYEKQVELYRKYNLSIPIYNIISEASVGKGIYGKIGFTPILKNHEIPEWYERVAAKCYLGARSEVVHRGVPIEIAYLDFMSQYPFCVSWLGLQDIQMAKTLVAIHCTSRIRKLFKTFKIEDLQKKDIGKSLRVFVKIKPNGHTLPFRAKLECDNYEIVRNTELYAPENWYTLLDVLADYIKRGAQPQIIDAVELVPYGHVRVNPIQFFGDTKYSIDANTQDFASSIIDVRKDVKTQSKQHAKDSDEYVNLDTLQYALKLIANSTTYGMYCETREENGIDVLGKFACYSIGSLIPACGRFLLGVVEALALKRGIRYVACDTDSMMLARPENVSREQFKKDIEEIKDFFKPMSVFKSSNDILELEEVNGEKPLYFIGISSKRYVVYHKLDNGMYHIRKATVNGVGYMSFNKDIDTVFPHDVPKPFYFEKNNRDIWEKKYTEYAPIKSLKSWQYLMWYRAIEQFEKGKTDVTIPIEEWSQQVVRHPCVLSTPKVMHDNRHIPDIRPYGFMIKVSANKGVLSYSSSFGSTSDEILENNMHDAKTHRLNKNPDCKRLYQQFANYFNYAEKKVIDGHNIGWLEKRVVHIDSVSVTTRKGKEVDAIQLALFNSDNI